MSDPYIAPMSHNGNTRKEAGFTWREHCTLETSVDAIGAEVKYPFASAAPGEKPVSLSRSGATRENKFASKKEKVMLLKALE